LQAERTGQTLPVENLFFDVNAKLEEQKKSGDEVTLGFSLLISTKPNVVRYSSAGSVLMKGKEAEVKKKLEVNPKTRIPQILFTVYQHVFNSIYILSSVLNTPYPPPDLLHPMAEKIQIVPTPVADSGEPGVSGEPSAAAPEVAGTGEKAAST
jgi:hypothetical protein